MFIEYYSNYLKYVNHYMQFFHLTKIYDVYYNGFVFNCDTYLFFGGNYDKMDLFLRGRKEAQTTRHSLVGKGPI